MSCVSIYYGMLQRSFTVTCAADLASFHSRNPHKSSHWDALEKSLTVFILPQSSSLYSGTRRRLDLIFAPPELYWTAVVGWYVAIDYCIEA